MGKSKSEDWLKAHYRKYYHKRNSQNGKMAILEVSAIVGELVSIDDVLDHYSDYRNPSYNIICGLNQAREVVKKWIKKYMKLLFTYRDEKRNFWIYYFVVKPENSILDTSKTKPRFITLGGKNPCKGMKNAYSKLVYKIKLHNHRKKTKIKYLILNEHQEVTQKVLSAHYHDNLMFMTNKKLTKAEMDKFLDKIKGIYAKELNIKYDDINRDDVGNNNVEEIKNEKDFEKTMHYVQENNSRVPYVKHTNDGEHQIQSLRNLENKDSTNKFEGSELQKYVLGLFFTAKGVHVSHFASIRGLKTFLRKYCTKSNKVTNTDSNKNSKKLNDKKIKKNNVKTHSNSKRINAENRHNNNNNNVKRTSLNKENEASFVSVENKNNHSALNADGKSTKEVHGLNLFDGKPLKVNEKRNYEKQFQMDWAKWLVRAKEIRFTPTYEIKIYNKIVEKINADNSRMMLNYWEVMDFTFDVNRNELTLTDTIKNLKVLANTGAKKWSIKISIPKLVIFGNAKGTPP